MQEPHIEDVHLLRAEFLDMQNELSEFYSLQQSACDVINRQCRELVLVKQAKSVQEERAEEFEARLKTEIGLGAAAVDKQQESAAAVAGLLRDREKNHEHVIAARRVIEEQAEENILFRRECALARQETEEIEETLRTNAETLEVAMSKAANMSEMEAASSREVGNLQELVSQRDAELLASALSHESTVSALETMSACRTRALEDLQQDSEAVTERLTYMEDRELALQCELAESSASEHKLRLELAEVVPILSETRQWGREEANALRVEAFVAAQVHDEAAAAFDEMRRLQNSLASRDLQLERIQSLMVKIRGGSGYSNSLYYDCGEALVGSPFTEPGSSYTPDNQYSIIR